MHTDGTDGLQKPAWAAGLLRQLGQAGPLTTAELTERLQAHHPGLTAEQVERELRARGDAHETAGGWVSLLALADGAVLSHLLGDEERKAGVLAADGDLDLWARLADEGLPLAGGGMVRTRWAFGAQELPGDASAALAGPDGWLEAFEDDTILTLRLRGGALEVGSLTEQQAVEDAAERVERVVEACALAAMDALRAFAEAVRVDYPDDDGQGDGPDEPSDPGAPIDDVLVELLLARPGMLDDPMPPLSLLLTAAGLEVVHGAVLLAGAPQDPDEVAGLTAEEIRGFTLARGFLWRREADRVSAEELGRFLSVLTLSPVVLERVADEVECNPADAALLEAARRAAATPVQRAAAALLAARAAEGDGRPVEAEELVLEALGNDPNLAPALWDAADYAATRGDAASADAHLRRGRCRAGGRAAWAAAAVAGLAAAHHSAQQPVPVRVGTQVQAVLPAHPLLSPVHAGPGALCQHRDLRDARPQRRGGPGAGRADRGGGGHVRARPGDLRGRRPPRLPGRTRGPAARRRAGHGGAVALSAAGPLRGDLGTAGGIADHAPAAGRRPGTPGRPVTVGRRAAPGPAGRPGPGRRGRSGAAGAPVAGRPAAAAGAAGAVRRRLRALGGRCLLRPAATAAAAQSRRPPADAVRRHLRPPRGRVEAAWRRLAAELEEDDGPDQLLAIGQLDDGEEVIRGSVHRQQRQLTITANSVERLGELRQQVLAAAPGSRLVSESIVPMEELLAEDGQDPGATADRDAEAQQLGLPPEEEAALLEELMIEYEQRWLDQKLPALDGRTPRQAAAEGGSALAELHALLDDIQWQGDNSGGGMSATRIRHHLGLTDT